MKQYHKQKNRRRAPGNKLLIIGLVMLAPMIVIAIVAPLISPHDPLKIDVMSILSKPSSVFPLGTDQLGRDLLSRLFFGTRISMAAGLVTSIVAGIIGLVLGALSGYYERVDLVVMRVMDAMMAYPGILLGIILVSALGANFTNTILAMSIMYIPRIARVVRSSVIEQKSLEYVSAARILGFGGIRIVVSQIVPNCLAQLTVQLSYCFAWAILAEAGLSFVGLGTPPPLPSWGNIISDGRDMIRNAPWLVIYPGMFLSFSVLGTNLLGDGLRDALDPRQRIVRSA